MLGLPGNLGTDVEYDKWARAKHIEELGQKRSKLI